LTNNHVSNTMETERLINLPRTIYSVRTPSFIARGFWYGKSLKPKNPLVILRSNATKDLLSSMTIGNKPKPPVRTGVRTRKTKPGFYKGLFRTEPGFGFH
jgi:hypothetical protein